MKATQTLKLQNGITRDGNLIHEITLREPSAGELRGIRLFDLVQGDAAALVDLLPRISAPTLTKQEANLLTLRDLANAMRITNDMLVDEETAGKPYPEA
mgnify:CR=1 FL=1